MVPRLVFLEMDRADIVTGGWRVEVGGLGAEMLEAGGGHGDWLW